MNIITLYLVLILALIQNGTSLTTGESENEPCQAKRQLDQQCVPHTYRVAKQLLDYIRQIKDEIEKSELKDREIRDLKDKLSQQEGNEKIIIQLNNQISYQQKTIDSLIASSTPSDSCDQVTKDLNDCSVKLEECENQFRTLNESLLQKDTEITSLNVKIKELNISNLQFIENEEKLLNKVKDLQFADRCIPFGNSQGKKIILPGIDAFDVLCDNQTAGPGWIVMLKKEGNKNDNFNKDWATYREGFGTFDGDYFLGLEKIHRLTNSRRYELFIKKDAFNRNTDYLYDDFVVDNEKTNYTLRSLGKLSLSEYNLLSYSTNAKFSTFDRDNDRSYMFNCAKDNQFGWWHAHCPEMFYRFMSYQSYLVMLIRPKE